MSASSELTDGCVVCGPHVSAIDRKVAESMFQTGETFTYRECLGCGTVQIAEVPADLARYYGPDYYSLTDPDAKSRLAHPVLNTVAGRVGLRLNTELFLRTGKGSGIDWTRTAGMRTSDRVLDVGCGRGEHLLALHRRGFRHLTGADPFLDRDRDVAPGVSLYRRHPDNIKGAWDWVMLHHTFEHVPNPRATLAAIDRLLAPEGHVLLRLPLAGGWAWRTYSADWVQLDAPRHLVLFSLSGLRTLASEQGFVMTQVVYDSSDFQIWGSELVRRGMPHRLGPVGFTSTQMQKWGAQAAELNQALDGDQAVIVLRKEKSSPA